MQNPKKLIIATLLLWVHLVAFPVYSQQLQVSLNDWALIYVSQTSTLTQVKWQFEGDSSQQHVVTTPTLSAVALSDNGKSLAYVDKQGIISILDTENETIRSLSVPMNLTGELLYSVDYPSSLHWSPSGRYLTFIGQTTTDRVDIYLYDLELATLKNVTQSLPIIRDYLAVSSWSLDEKWLSFVGAWRKDNEGGVIVEPGILSIGTGALIPLSPNQRTCGLYWSPDNRHLASTTECFEPSFGNASLLIFSFDPENPTSSNSVDVIPSGKDPDAEYWWYSEPRWRTNDDIVFPRDTGPRGTDLSPDDFEEKFVQYNLVTKIESPITGVDLDVIGPDMRGNWGIWNLAWTTKQGSIQFLLKAYNFVTSQIFASPPGLSLCPAIYTRISSSAKLIALLTGCTVGLNYTIQVFDLVSSQEVFRVDAVAGEFLRPVGFIRKM